MSQCESSCYLTFEKRGLVDVFKQNMHAQRWQKNIMRSLINSKYASACMCRPISGGLLIVCYSGFIIRVVTVLFALTKGANTFQHFLMSQLFKFSVHYLWKLVSLELRKTIYASINAFNLVVPAKWSKGSVRFPARQDCCQLIVRLLANASLQASNHLSNVTVQLRERPLTLRQLQLQY